MTFQERFKDKISYIKKDGVRGLIRQSKFKPTTNSDYPSTTTPPTNQLIDLYQNQFIERSIQPIALHHSSMKVTLQTPLRKTSFTELRNTERKAPFDRSVKFSSSVHQSREPVEKAEKERSCLVRVGSNILEDRFRLNIDELAEKHRNIIRIFDTTRRF